MRKIKSKSFEDRILHLYNIKLTKNQVQSDASVRLIKKTVDRFIENNKIENPRDYFQFAEIFGNEKPLLWHLWKKYC